MEQIKQPEQTTVSAARSLTDFDLETLRTEFVRWGHNGSHASRLLREFYLNAGQIDFEKLKIGRVLEMRFKSEIALRQSRITARTQSTDGTIKLLVGFDRGGAVETVLMPSNIPERAAGCVSSQIGCAMGCDFCASTKRGLERNLEAGEIVEQFLYLRELAALGQRRLHTLVFMGMGEPMHNLDNVILAIRRIADEKWGALGWRQITVSTVGIVPGIDKLAATGLNVNLAVSLHAPDDETRSKIVPMNNRYNVVEIVEATRRFYQKTRRITNIEYCLLSGVNDSDEHAHKLAELLKHLRTHVNLIAYNAIGAGLSGISYARPSVERINSFLTVLRSAGIVTHVRQTRGDDVNAACGQLLAESSLPIESIVVNREYQRAANGGQNVRPTSH